VLIANTFTFVALAVVIRLLRDLAHEAVARAKIGEVTDPLTGLLNRRGFERQGSESWRRRAQQELPLVLMLVDIDHFKRVNDTMGHAAGDELLRRLGVLLTSTLREGDHAFRFGGEEFAVLAYCGAGEASVLGERIRSLVENHLPVTVSIGVVEAIPTADHDATRVLWEFIAKADTGLYAAKNAGRNNIQLVSA
jgi:diguanylate cyclase (GGDEF)-like protein